MQKQQSGKKKKTQREKCRNSSHQNHDRESERD